MDYGKAFTYVFDDSQWLTKLLIGGLLFLGGIVIIPLFFPLGYMVETIQNLVEGRKPLLPEWDNWGEKFSKGVILFIINLIYQLPGLLLSAISTGLDIAAEQSQSAPISIALSGPIIGLSCLRMIYSILVAFVLPAIIIQYATTGKFEAAFRFKEIYKFIRQNIGDYFVVFILGFAAGLIGFAGIIVCCVGIAFTMFYANLVNAHLYGQLYKQSLKTAQP